MPVTEFPPLEFADERGLLAIGGDLSPETLLLAYRSAIFPWPASADSPLLWFSPPERMVLWLDKLRIPRSTKKIINRDVYKVRFDVEFRRIIEHCATSSRRSSGTWITSGIIDAYHELFKRGHAYSVGVYESDELIGGLYGVRIGKMVTGESMFHLKPEASKFALVKLVEKLMAEGIEWIDCQQETPLLTSLGGELIPREKFVSMVNTACSE